MIPKKGAFYFAEKPGPHNVGLKVIENRDDSRGRLIQTLVWYPAEGSVGPAMTVEAYANLLLLETGRGDERSAERHQEWRSALSSALGSPLWAIRDAKESAGRFPVIIYAPGFSNPSWENADLCEYVASHGYVLLASPSMGADAGPMTMDLAGINAQAKDISFLISYAESLPNANTLNTAVMGFSWGGIANVFAAARDTRVKALISLDGSLRFSPGMVKHAGDIDPNKMTRPLLSIAQGQWTPEDQDAFFDAHPDHDGPSVLNAWTQGDLMTVHMLGLSHMDHCSMYQRNERAWGEGGNPQKKADYGPEDGITGYAWIARYSLAFLNAYLKQVPEAMNFMRATPRQNGAPLHFMATKFRAAAETP